MSSPDWGRLPPPCERCGKLRRWGKYLALSVGVILSWVLLIFLVGYSSYGYTFLVYMWLLSR